MRWQDAQVWLPTLLFSDHVLFPQCVIKVRMDEAAYRPALEPLHDDAMMVNVFWVARVDRSDREEIRVSPIGTISKLIPSRTRERATPGGTEEIVLQGLFKVRCEGLRETHRRLESRFRILKENLNASEDHWMPLLEELKTWLQILAFHLGPPATLTGSRTREEMPEVMINRLCMELPFPPATKQDLLELPDPYLRGRALCRLLEKTVRELAEEPPASPDGWVQ